MAGHVAFTDLDIGGLEGENAAARHRVAGVDGEIEEHLLQLGRVDLDPSDLGVETHQQFDVFAEGAPQQLLALADLDVQVQHPRPQDLLATHCKELAGQAGGVLAG